MLAITTWVVFGADVRLLLQARPQMLQQLTETFNSDSTPAAVTVRGLQQCTDGWCLPANADGELRYEAAVLPAARRVDVVVWIILAPGTTNQLGISTDGGRSFRTLAENINATGKIYPVDLPPGTHSVVLRVDAHNRSAERWLCVDQIALWSFAGPPVPPFRRPQLVGAFACLGLCLVLLSRRPWWTLLAVVVVCAGAWLRLDFLLRQLPLPLEPDASGYAKYARSFSLFGRFSFYSADFGFREPLFICLTHCFFLLVGDSNYHLRLFTFFLSLGLIGAVIRFGRARLGPFAGLVMGLLTALNGPLARESARGLRLEAETLLWLAFLWIGFLASRLPGWRRAFALGVVGGLAALIRTTYLPVVVALAVFAFAERPKAGLRWLRYAAVAAAVPVLLMLPHRYGMYRVHGDAFYDTGVYARWNANMEFGGQPGFPTHEQVIANRLAGPPLTYAEYLRLHTGREFVAGTMSGYAKLYDAMRMSVDAPDRSVPLFALTRALQLLGLVGFALAVFSARDRWLPLAFVLAEFAPAFLYDRGLVETYRHTYQGYPLFLMAAGLAGSAMVARGSAFWPRKRKRALSETEPV